MVIKRQIRIALKDSIDRIDLGLLCSVKILLGLSLILLTACSHTTGETVKLKVAAPEPKRAAFSHCSSYGCNKVQQVAFNDDEWQSIIAIFNDPATTPLEERQSLPQAIAMMERIIGPKTGTNDDIARSWTVTFVPQGQLDCIDESINTTTYLELLNNAGFIRHHAIGKIALRGGGFDFKMLHNTATLIDHDSGHSYAVDSWFRSNGVLPDVVPLEDWLNGWKPTSE